MTPRDTLRRGMDRDAKLDALAAMRMRVAGALTAAVVVVYFGFILLIAYAKPLLATLLAPGLSLGILLGALVIVISWLLTWRYVRWANRRYDPALDELRE
ncbi:MAG: DUF485 domain-containing protein [Myxococcota bacterium]